MHICIDPGHGGSDRYNRGPTGYIEADGVLDIALRLRYKLQQAGIKVTMTRNTDKTVTPVQRIAIANNSGADALISIHTNAATNPQANGVEAFYSLFTTTGNKLASYLVNQVSADLKLRNRGIKTRKASNGRDYYYIIRDTSMPAVIIECAFHTNVREEALLKQANFRQQLADSIAKAVFKYFGINELQQPIRPGVKIYYNGRDITAQVQPQVANNIAKASIEPLVTILGHKYKYVSSANRIDIS